MHRFWLHRQENIRRLLACSAIAHAGRLMVELAAVGARASEPAALDSAPSPSISEAREGRSATQPRWERVPGFRTCRFWPEGKSTELPGIGTHRQSS
ncbi:MAG: hypothetical protein ACE5JL_14880 [Dehalococcoidia bacterium]